MAVDKTLTPVGQGVSATEENDELLINAFKKQIEIKIENINQSFDRDVHLEASGSLTYPDGSRSVLTMLSSLNSSDQGSLAYSYPEGIMLLHTTKAKGGLYIDE
ncbi:MAG: hypothetical protein ACYS30_21985 [Planctomycetota bacterium]|jgi:hypothetical protein